LKGSLFEDSLFCPVVKSSFESLDWWGENAFFSRAAQNCPQQTNCKDCITLFEEDCGWCTGTSQCAKLGTGNCHQFIGCSVNFTSLVPAKEDISQIWNINPLFAVKRETNATGELSTSANYTVAAVTLNTNCNVTFDAGTDSITVNPVANWFGNCTVKVSAVSRFLTRGANTTLASTVTFGFASENDPVMRNEANWDTAVSALNTINQTATVTLEGCKMFYDDDRQDFSLSTTTTTNTGTAPTINVGNCKCYTGSLSCPIQVKAVASWEGKIIFTAADFNSTVTFGQDVTITSVNGAPVANGGNATITPTPRETDEAEIRQSFAGEFTDPDPGTTLTFTLNDGFGSLTLSAAFDGSDLVLKINPVLLRTSTAVSRVTASDGFLTATKYVSLTVIAVNDPVVILDSVRDKTFTAASATNETFDLINVVTDEESSFAAGTLYCTPGTISGGEAIVTITKNIMLIQHRQETSGVSCQITCNDTSGSADQGFNINIVNTLVNQPPVVKATFPSFTSPPPATGSINLSPSLVFANYFSDPNIYQTITYTITPSNSTAVSYTLVGTTGFTVVMYAGAYGSHTLNVTAADEKGASTSQLVRVLAYVAVTCQTSVSSFWTPTSPFTLDLASYCSSSNTFNVTFQGDNNSQTIYSKVTPTINGTKVIFTSSDPCADGVYTGVATVTDSLGGQVSTSISLTTNNTQNSIRALKSSFSYLVTSGSVNGTAYDGKVEISNSEITFSLNQFIAFCGNGGPARFENTSAVSVVPYTDGNGGSTANVKVYGEIEDTWFTLEGIPTAQLTQRKWVMTVSIKAIDTASSNTAAFNLTITKDQ